MTRTQTDRNAVFFSFFGPSVVLASSTRPITEPRRLQFLAECGLDAQQLVTVEQVHQDRIVTVKANQKPDPAFEADGLLTSCPGLVLAVKTADCVPIFLWDPERRVAGVVHAGWKGLKAQILPKAVHRMKKDFGSQPQSVQIAFGPCIRPCCYEVGPEFEGLFPAFFEPNASGKGNMDLVGCARAQALDSGLLPDHLFDCRICNACENGTFFSVRREPGTSERILSVISSRS